MDGLQSVRDYARPNPAAGPSDTPAACDAAASRKSDEIRRFFIG
jgi:hypothetical protein